MWIQWKSRVPGLDLKEFDRTVEIRLSTPEAPVVELSFEETGRPKGIVQRAFEIRVREELPDDGHPALVAFLRAFAAGTVPAHYVAPDVLAPIDLTRHALEPSWMPDELGSVLGEARERLRNCADSVVGALRWRLGLMGPVRPFRDSSYEWSLDGDTWREFSPRLFALLEDSAVRDLTGEILADVAELVSTGRSEPLPYTLWREAWELSAQYPRSAVLIGIAALEVGTKRYIASAAPDTEWLVRELQSPPLSDLFHIHFPSWAPGALIEVGSPPLPKSTAVRSAKVSRSATGLPTARRMT